MLGGALSRCVGVVAGSAAAARVCAASARVFAVAAAFPACRAAAAALPGLALDLVPLVRRPVSACTYHVTHRHTTKAKLTIRERDKEDCTRSSFLFLSTPTVPLAFCNALVTHSLAYSITSLRSACVLKVFLPKIFRITVVLQGTYDLTIPGDK